MFCACAQPRKVEVKEIAFNPTFITRMIPKIDWTVLKSAAETVSPQPFVMHAKWFRRDD